MKFIDSRYGSTNGLVQHLYHRFTWPKMGMEKMKNVDLARVKRLVFVCRGNICRSPFCEYVARSEGIDAVSYGLECRKANPVRERIAAAAQRFGLEMDAHRSTDIARYRPSATDLVVVTEPDHAAALEGRIGDAQLTLLGLWTSPRTLYIHDPYSANQKYCERCTSLMHGAVVRLVDEIKTTSSAIETHPVAAA